MKIAALFVLPNSIYKTLPGVDCYDEQRDARTFDMSCPVVAHPPCRSWSRLKAFSKGSQEDKALAPWAVDVVRKCGGVLEHPAYSSLWGYCNLPKPGYGYDDFGGWTLDIDQHWFGHMARKQTWLYIVGCKSDAIPGYSISLDAITHVVDTSQRANRKYKYLAKRHIQATPVKLAEWLVELARRCEVNE